MKSARLLTLAMLLSAVPATAYGQVSSISSNFNGTAIAATSDIWFNAVFKLNVKWSDFDATTGIKLQYVDGKIDLDENDVPGGIAGDPFNMPSATIIFSNATASISAATTVWTTGQPIDGSGLCAVGYTVCWVTNVPWGHTGNVFLSGRLVDVGDANAAGFPGGINPVVWSGTFNSIPNTPPVYLSWKWAAAVYSDACTPGDAGGNNYGDLNEVQVKPLDSNMGVSPFDNSNKAGTPMAMVNSNISPCLMGGGRGGTGSNFTGSYSGTKSTETGEITEPPEDVVPEPATVLLFATGLSLLGLGTIARRRRNT